MEAIHNRIYQDLGHSGKIAEIHVVSTGTHFDVPGLDRPMSSGPAIHIKVKARITPEQLKAAFDGRKLPNKITSESPYSHLAPYKGWYSIPVGGSPQKPNVHIVVKPGILSSEIRIVSRSSSVTLSGGDRFELLQSMRSLLGMSS